MQPSRIVLVTGASRGIGADIARRLADPETHVVIGYREREYRANAVAEDIREAGGHATPLAGDITDAEDTTAMIKVIAERFGRLDTLILNASGALQPGVDAGSAMRVDRDAQRRLAALAMPLMSAGAHIVFVTNHQAHFYPDKAVPKGGAAFAAGRRAGETALYAMRADFDRAGIRFSVVSGDTSDQALASSVVDVAATPNPSGIVYVGGADYLMIA